MHLPYDITKNIVWNDMQTAATLMDSVASGRKPNQLICSPSGFGKTAIAKQRFNGTASCRRRSCTVACPRCRRCPRPASLVYPRTC